MSNYLKILSCKHYNNNDASTVYSNGFVVGNVWDEIDTYILAEIKNKTASIDFSFNTVSNNTNLYNGVVGNYVIAETLFNSEISAEPTAFSGSVNANQGITSQLQKNAPFSGFSDYADATINFKYETPTLAATASWLIGTSYNEGDYSKTGGGLYVALVDNVGQDPTATTGFWALVQENTFIYEIVHKWTLRPYLPESDTNGANTVQPSTMAGANALKYIFRINFQDATFLTSADKSTERVVGDYDATQEFKTDDYAVYNGVVWRSLQDTNVGNAPDVSPLFWELDPSLDLNDFMQPSNTGFYDEKYNGLAPKYTLNQLLTPSNSNVDNSDNIDYSIQIKNNEGDFTTDASIIIHSLLERNGIDFDTSLTATENTQYKSLTVLVDGTTTPNLGNGIENATATIDGSDASLANVTFTIAAATYEDRFGVFVTPFQNVVETLPPDCGVSQSSGGEGVTTQVYTGYADGAYSVDYNMLKAADAMEIFIFDIGNPTERITLATTGGAVSGTGTLNFNFVAANAVSGHFHILVDGGFNTGTKWYYTLNCPSGAGSSIIQSSFSESNNIWLSAYDIVVTVFDDLQLIGDVCAGFNFYFHYDDLNERDGVSQFKGFQNDFALIKFQMQNTNPARTVINEFQLAIKRQSGATLESYSIKASELDFATKTNVTFTNNDKSNISLSNVSGVYSGEYGFVVKSEWVKYDDVIFQLLVGGNIVKTTVTEPFTKNFDSNIFGLGGLDVSKNTLLEPIVLKYGDSVEFWTTDELTQLAAPLDTGLTRIIARFKEINLGSLEATLAELTGYLFLNESGGVTDNQYIHDRADVLQSSSAFTPIAPNTGALIEIDGGDPTIVTIKSDFDASKSPSCFNLGARLDRTDPNPPPIETAFYSLHFVGEYEGNNQTILFDEQVGNLQVHNILNMATSYTIKYKDTHAAVDWSLEPAEPISTIQTLIDSGSSTYSLHFEITSYSVIYLNAVLCLEYDSIGTNGTIQYASNNILAQNVWIGLPSGYEITVDSITSGNASASVFYFGLKTSSGDDMTEYDESLASLNINLSGNTSEKLITIYVEYQGVNLNDTFDIETTII